MNHGNGTVIDPPQGLASTGRILYASSVDVSRPNGPGVNEREFLTALFDAMGERAHAVLPKTRDPVDDLPDAGITWVRPLDRRNPRSLLAHKSEMLSAIESRITAGVDLIVVRLDVVPFEILRLKRRQDVPYVVKTLGASFGTPPGGGGIENSLRRAGWHLVGELHRRVTLEVLKDAIAVDACTPELCQRAAERMGADPSKVHLVGNATNVERFRPLDPAEAAEVKRRLGLAAFDPIVGFVGGLPWKRGGRQMIDAAPHLIGEHPDLGVVIVGGGAGMDELRDHADRLGVGARVVTPGVVPYERVSEYVSCFDVGIAMDDPERHREFGNSYQKIRQYLACGTPVVSVSGSGLPLEEEGLGTVVRPDAPDEIVRAIHGWLALDDVEREAHRVRAVEFARRRLSVESTLAQRFAIWDRSLSVS